MEIIGYISAMLIGVSLGIIGGGGSILTVPVLVYLFHVEPVTATAYSLFIVGTTSLIGMIPKYRDGLVSVRTAIVFGIPSIAAVYLTRKWIIPVIPNIIYQSDSISIDKSFMMMTLFAILMVLSSVSMIRPSKIVSESAIASGKQPFNYPLIILEGLLVGTLTGLVGAGGGFLIIPALILLSNLPVKKAIGTSLLIIAAKSLIGFLGDLNNGHTVIEWSLLLPVSVLSIAGIFIGNKISGRIQPTALKKGFGWFVLIMGLYIMVQQMGQL